MIKASRTDNGWWLISPLGVNLVLDNRFISDEIVAAIDEARALDKRPALGKTVEWTSQAGGRSKTKRGTVVAVVLPGGHPKDYIGSGHTVDAGSLGRDHESYLVQVGRSKRLYWPLVSKLQVIR